MIIIFKQTHETQIKKGSKVITGNDINPSQTQIPMTNDKNDIPSFEEKEEQQVEESSSGSIDSSGTFAAVASILAIFCCLTSLVLMYIIWNNKRKEIKKLKQESKVPQLGLKIGIASDSINQLSSNNTFSPFSPDCATFPSSSSSIIHSGFNTQQSPTLPPVYTTPMKEEEEHINDGDNLDIPRCDRLNKDSMDSNDSMYQECKVDDNEWAINTPQHPQDIKDINNNNNFEATEMTHLVTQTVSRPSHSIIPPPPPAHHQYHYGYDYNNHNNNHYQHGINPWHNIHTMDHSGIASHIGLSQFVSNSPVTPDGIIKRKQSELYNIQSQSLSGVDYNQTNPLNHNNHIMSLRKQTVNSCSFSSIFGPGYNNNNNNQNIPSSYYQPANAPNIILNRNRNLSLPPSSMMVRNSIDENKEEQEEEQDKQKEENDESIFPSIPNSTDRNLLISSSTPNRNEKENDEEEEEEKLPPSISSSFNNERRNSNHSNFTDITRMTDQSVTKTTISKNDKNEICNNNDNDNGESSATEIEFELKINASDEQLNPLLQDQSLEENDDDDSKSNNKELKLLSPKPPSKRFRISVVSPVSLPDIPEDHDTKEENDDGDGLITDLSKTTEDKSLISSSLTETSAIKEYNDNGGILRKTSIENAFDINDEMISLKSPQTGTDIDSVYVD